MNIKFPTINYKKGDKVKLKTNQEVVFLVRELKSGIAYLDDLTNKTSISVPAYWLEKKKKSSKISEHFSQLGKKSWESRKRKLLKNK